MNTPIDAQLWALADRNACGYSNFKLLKWFLKAFPDSFEGTKARLQVRDSTVMPFIAELLTQELFLTYQAEYCEGGEYDY